MSPCGCRIDRRFGLPHDAGAGFQFAKTDWKIAFDCFFGPFLYPIPWNRNSRISAASGASAPPFFFGSQLFSFLKSRKRWRKLRQQGLRPLPVCMAECFSIHLGQNPAPVEICGDSKYLRNYRALPIIGVGLASSGFFRLMTRISAPKLARTASWHGKWDSLTELAPMVALR